MSAIRQTNFTIIELVSPWKPPEPLMPIPAVVHSDAEIETAAPPVDRILRSATPAKAGEKLIASCPRCSRTGD
jgi:hypothetical protein